jgi:hypothetical protein
MCVWVYVPHTARCHCAQVNVMALLYLTKGQPSFRMPVFTEQHHVQIPHTEFHKTPTISVWKYGHKFKTVAFTLPISTTHHSPYLGEGRASHVPTVLPKMCTKTTLTASSKARPSLDWCSHNSSSFNILPWIRDVPNSVKFGTEIQKARRYFIHAPKQSASFAAPISVALHEDSLCRQWPTSVQAGALTASPHDFRSA